ncbi:putative membrane protein YczE [Clostridium punense]|uniref:Membrane protein YczE n=1 Tax=Clostridium punense TaxID=1054297 RepID=A0ABS4K6T6_9CLOT|nr:MULTISPECIES: membrane protein [Clostridium]EQB87356.1 hypothetical protein M918_09665 [Clostridium sp. BL8]MBP2023484.1 putative membrane protein YczE [Clostridium punense]
MKKLTMRITKLFFGLFLYATGIVLTINANIGLSPWDVFHQGLSNTVGITMGQANIIGGFAIIIYNAFAGEKIGWGTISNMIFIGIFVDILMLNRLIPVFHNIILQIVMMGLGMLVIGAATYFYISVGLGSGPRDGLMIALTKKTNKSVRFIRSCIEITVVVLGSLLGGSFGIGTLIMAFAMGPCVQFVFKLFKFNVKGVKHRFIDEDIKYIKDRFILKNNRDNKVDCEDL